MKFKFKRIHVGMLALVTAAFLVCAVGVSFAGDDGNDSGNQLARDILDGGVKFTDTSTGETTTVGSGSDGAPTVTTTDRDLDCMGPGCFDEAHDPHALDCTGGSCGGPGAENESKYGTGADCIGPSCADRFPGDAPGGGIASHTAPMGQDEHFLIGDEVAWFAGLPVPGCFGPDCGLQIPGDCTGPACGIPVPCTGPSCGFTDPDCGPMGCSLPGVNPMDCGFGACSGPFGPTGAPSSRDTQFISGQTQTRNDLGFLVGFPDTNQAISQQLGQPVRQAQGDQH